MVDYWVPAAVNPKALKDRYWNVVARLKAGVAVGQAQTELAALTARQAQGDRELEGFLPRLVPLTAELNRDGRGILLPLLGAAALVLLIACGKMAALLLVRGFAAAAGVRRPKRHGMGRWGLLRQVSAEALLLATAGGVLGAGLAIGAVKGHAGDRRARDSAAGRCHDGVDGAGVGLWHGRGRGHPGGVDSGAASLPAGSDRSTEERRAEEQRGSWRAPLAGHGDDGADRADVGATGRERVC
jgi:hypothetical protein